jgi:hypothetical protein
MSSSKASQKRISTTSKVLGSMREVKMLGMINRWFESIHQLRMVQLDKSKRFRQLIVWSNVVGKNALPLRLYAFAAATDCSATKEYITDLASQLTPHQNLHLYLRLASPSLLAMPDMASSCPSPTLSHLYLFWVLSSAH